MTSKLLEIKQLSNDVLCRVEQFDAHLGGREEESWGETLNLFSIFSFLDETFL